LRTSRGFNLPEANRRTVIRSARLEQKIKELEAYQEWIENEVLSLPSAKGKLLLKCACEGCPWFDGWNSKLNKPNCLNPDPPIDKKMLSKTAGNLCKENQKLLVQIELDTNKQIPRKNRYVVLALARKLYFQDAENTAIQQDQSFLRTEDQMKKLNEAMQPYLKSIGKTHASEKKMQKSRDRKPVKDKREKKVKRQSYSLYTGFGMGNSEGLPLSEY